MHVGGDALEQWINANFNDKDDNNGVGDIGKSINAMKGGEGGGRSGCVNIDSNANRYNTDMSVVVMNADPTKMGVRGKLMYILDKTIDQPFHVHNDSTGAGRVNNGHDKVVVTENTNTSHSDGKTHTSSSSSMSLADYWDGMVQKTKREQRSNTALRSTSSLALLSQTLSVPVPLSPVESQPQHRRLYTEEERRTIKQVKVQLQIPPFYPVLSYPAGAFYSDDVRGRVDRRSIFSMTS